jgi:hypothetical protein
MNGARAVRDRPHPMAGMDSFLTPGDRRTGRDPGVAKARAPAVTTFVLGVVAGAFGQVCACRDRRVLNWR